MAGKLRIFFNTPQQVWLQHFLKKEIQNSFLSSTNDNGHNNEKNKYI